VFDDWLQVQICEGSCSLADHAAAQVSVDQSTFGLIGGFAKLLVGDPFTAREAGKRLGLENAHP
jgi:hypothetical protein